MLIRLLKKKQRGVFLQVGVLTPAVTFGGRAKQERKKLLTVSPALIIVTTPSRASRFVSGGPG